MLEILNISPELIRGLSTGVGGALISGFGVHLIERAKHRRLKRDNARLVQDTEEIKSNFNRQLEELKRDHQLEISKRKYKYESKKTSYISFFQKLDLLNEDLALKSTVEIQENIRKFTESCVYSQTDEEYNKGLVDYQVATHSILLDANKDIYKLKHETSEIKLHASDKIIKGLDELEKAYQRMMQESHLLIQQMPEIIKSGDSNLMTLNQQDLIQQALHAETIKENLIKSMREELDEI